MKKSKLLIVGLIALMLTGGLWLASCGMDCSGGCGRSPRSCSGRCASGLNFSSTHVGCAEACK